MSKIIDDDDDDELLVHQLDAFAATADELPPAMVGPAGFMNLLQPEPLPEITEETLVCLRGPCRHYVEIKKRFDAGNTKGSLDHVPMQWLRFCKAIPGYTLELTDENIYDCNQWAPQDQEALVQLSACRATYKPKQDSSKKGDE